MAWPLCLSLAVAAGCDGAAPPSPQQPLPPLAGNPSTTMQWRGLLACADCDGIDMTLQLHSADDAPRYELVELFLVRGGEERFVERGRWARDGRFLRLRADDGAERVFVIEADGRLSVRDRDGDFPAGVPRLLEPVTPHPPP